jgi:hypothetical protein
VAEPQIAAADREVLLEIVKRIDSAELAKRLSESFREQVPSYRRVSNLQTWSDVREISRLNFSTLIRTVADGRLPSEAELAPFRTSARSRAADEVPLEDLLHAYRAGGRIAWQALSGAARPAEQGALLVGADLIMQYIDVVSAVIAQAYLDERQHVVSEEDQRLRELLDALAVPAPLPSDLQALAKELALPVLLAYRPFAAILRDGSPRDHSRIAKALRARGVLAVTEGRRITGLVDPDRARGLIGQAASLAIGESTHRAELAAALDEVRMLADLGHALGREGELAPADFLPELMLSSSPRLASRLRERALGPLEAYADRRGTDLVETLAAFLRNQCDRRETAAALHVHPNTVDYRLGRVEELTGLNLNRPGDLLLVTLGIIKRELDEVQ